MANFAIDEAALKDQISFDISAPQFLSNSHVKGKGLPVKQIPVLEFPRIVYKHPSEPLKRVEHRNAMHELVDVEMVPTEHLEKKVSCREHKEIGGPATCEECKVALEAAIAEGWTTEPYIAKGAPDPNAAIYEPKKAKK